MKFLDDSLFDLVNDREASIIITGDHGCRLVSRYVIEHAGRKKDTLSVYNVDGDLIKFCEEHVLESFKDILDIQYDGGILRMWLKGKNDLSEKDTSFFSEYGYVFPHYIHQKNVNQDIIRLYENSKHENLGDILVVAKGDAMFCKLDWIKDFTIENIAKKRTLEIGELPIGEHGTHHIKDREVCLLSNRDLGDRVSNIEIYGYIKKIVG